MSRSWATGCGVFLIVTGGILALVSAGVIQADIWAVALSAFFIGVGAMAIWAAMRRDGAPLRTEFNVSRGGASEARVVVRYGAGRLRVGPGAAPENLAEVRGNISGNRRVDSADGGRRIEAVLSVDVLSDGIPPWNWGSRQPPEWDVRLAKDLPLDLEIDAGACETRLDLTDLKVRTFRLQSGASDTEVRMPAAAGHVRSSIRVGAAAVRIVLPPGIGGRIVTQSGLGEVRVDRSRFQPVLGGHETPDYATAENRVEIEVVLGAASVDVR